MRHLLLSGAALGALAGCSTSEEDGAFLAAFDRAVADYEAASSEAYTPEAALPASGSATYEGTVYLDTGFAGAGTEPDGDDDLVGDLSLRVGFAGDGSVTGAATDFVGEGDQRYDGRLAVSDGSVDTSLDPDVNYNFLADLDGTLTDEGGTDYDLSGGIGGNFTGGRYDYVIGAVGGSACQGPDCSDFDGGFAAAR